MFRALRNRNFRLYFSGQGISLIGTWMQRMASDWLIYELTHSAMWLGVNAFISQAPNLLIAPFAGVYVDRMSRHRLLIVTQAMAMVQAIVLAWLVLKGAVVIGLVVSLNFILGVVNAIDTPVRQSFVIDMLDRKDDLPNAIALNSSLVTVTKLIGPTVAGFMIASFGEGPCFLLNGLSYIAVLAALWAMQIGYEKKISRSGSVLLEVREGIHYAFGFAPIRSVIVLLACTSLVAMPYMTLLPMFAADILGGGAHTLGLLTAATGVGSLVGAGMLAGRRSVLRLGRVIAISCACFGFSLVGFAFSHHLLPAIVWLSLSGLGMILQLAATNTILQTLVDDEKRGRVMSLYTVAFLGVAPFGGLMAGSLASAIGAPHTVALCGVGCLVGAFWFYRQLPHLSQQVRSLYVKKGIIKEVPGDTRTVGNLF